ncbi:MAG TPA: 50S ribosomal protein L13 [Polyangiaceae bacterium]|nr:50S ribosomal protein L13 [Polyangiaceae bacterium]
MSTFVAKPAEAQATRKWYVVDATDLPLGRLASKIATMLRGKHKPTYTPHVDTGDFVIVINAGKVKLTGNKATDKMYYRHSGYAGAIRSISFEHLVVKHPETPITQAVKGMLPKNVLGRQMLEKLKVYGTADHPHRAQQPETFSI